MLGQWGEPFSLLPLLQIGVIAARPGKGLAQRRENCPILP